HKVKIASLTILLIISWVLLSATLIVNENIQSWSAHTGYGNYTQEIPAGTVALESCLVSPGAAVNGAGSLGRIQCQASIGAITFPVFSSFGEVEFIFSAGSAGRSIKLQKYVAGSWVDLFNFTGITSTGSRFFYQFRQESPTTIRLANSSHAVYIHDIFITDYQDSSLPLVSLPIAGNITYNTASMSAFIESSGTSAITNRGFCWSTAELPDTSSTHIEVGYGISPMNTVVSGLIPDTDYHLCAYAVNATGVGYSPSAMIHTLSIDVPTMQTSNLVFYPGNTSIQTSWTPGNGSRRLIKINMLNDFSTPTEGVEYAPNSVYSGTGEQVVYCDATQVIEGDNVDAVTVTGLIRNTQYWFRAYELNGSGESVFYLLTTTTGNPASTITLNTGLAGYYDSISGYGAELKTELHNLIRTSHLNQFSYSAVWQQLQYTDEDSLNANNVIETYTGWSVPKNFYGSGVTQWNREHTWSVSHGGFETNRPAGTDLHHLRPCDVTVNSAKSNRDFDLGGIPYVDASPYADYNATTGCNTDADSWEPRTVEKGDIARMLLYMATRYEGTDTGYNLEMQDLTPTVGSYYGKLSTLLQWHYDDPPDSWERRRNDRIQERQGNRNPFIDHPEYVTAIWTPHIVRAYIMAEDNFVVQWTHAVNAESYRVDISADSLFTTFLVQDYDTGYAFMRNFEITQTDTVYFRVRAFYGSGVGAWSDTLRVEILLHPVEISSFEVTLNEDGNALVAWTSVSETDLRGYHIYRSESPQPATAEMITLFMIPATNTSTAQNYSFIDENIPGGDFSGYLYYWLEAISLDGTPAFFGPDSIYILPSGLEDPSAIPVAIMSSVYPNPFTNTVNIEYSLKDGSPVEIQIFNLKGQRVKNWQGSGLAGKNSFVWNGLDDKWQRTASGIYLLKFSTGKHQQSTKLLKL
ncbi:MAG: endonuclease, partial [Candidatus Cloacimonas sp.]|nr:endonuclease [Candidatus Cloacimonas sp.]